MQIDLIEVKSLEIDLYQLTLIPGLFMRLPPYFIEKLTIVARKAWKTKTGKLSKVNNLSTNFQAKRDKMCSEKAA